ncbi:MAG TPA: BON domain-containing protein [Polyangia bacterium]|nr:BON domain-containing protein [Polyangia bacterium]
MRTTLIGAAWLVAASVGCTRASESPAPVQRDESAVGQDVKQDVKGVARATQKAAQDLGHATVDLANKAGVGGQDAWITTKVKGALTSGGIDPTHVHVDTADKVVTLSGSVASSADAQRAVAAAKAVEGVAAVKDHLFIEPTQR